MSDTLTESLPKTSTVEDTQCSEELRLNRQRSRIRFNRFIKLVRRSHLYAGLFMTPWVFLYGITAFLFNHPTVLSDLTTYSFDSTHIRGTDIDRVPDAESLARQAVDTINRITGDSYVLVQPGSAKFTRPLTVLLGNGRENYQVSYDLNRKSGTVRKLPARSVQAADHPQVVNLPTRLELDSIRIDDIKQSFAALMTKIDVNASGLKPLNMPGAMSGPNRDQETSHTGRTDESRSQSDQRRTQPDSGSEKQQRKSDSSQSHQETRSAGLQAGGAGRETQPGTEVEFVMQGPDHKTFNVAYNIQTGQMRSRETSVPGVGPGGEALSTRRFFLRLHTAHGFPTEFNARWLWAIAVDMMFISMVGWGLTGLVMWYQMKHLRRIGGYVLLLSLIVSVALACGMHAEIAAIGR